MVTSSSHGIVVTWDEMENWYHGYEERSYYEESCGEMTSSNSEPRKRVKLNRWTNDEVLLLKRLAKIDGVINNAALFARKHARRFPKRTLAAIKNKVYHLKLYTNPNK